MALTWNWDKRVGTATLVQKHEEGKETEYSISLYEGNAFLIFIHEYEEDGKEKYELISFWGDKRHMLNCLGLNKKEGFTENLYVTPAQEYTKFRLNKNKCRHINDIIPALVRAFDKLTIEIVSGEEV